MESNYSLTLNISNPDELTILELSLKIKYNIICEFEFEFRKLPEENPM